MQLIVEGTKTMTNLRSSRAPAVTLDVSTVCQQFSALQRPTVFLDGPGGTQTPDSVIEAVSAYLREDNANVDGPFARSRRTNAIVAKARQRAAAFLGCSGDEVGFGLNMTSLNFHLSRTVGRELKPGDEIVVTKLDHDANVSPWLEIAADRDLVVHMANIHDDTRLDIDDLERLLTERTRIVAFPWASNAVGTVVDAARICDLAHRAGAIAWIDATHFAAHRPINVKAAGADVLLCSPYKFFGPHLGLFYARQELLERWRPYKVRPAADEPLGHRFETGTLPHEALAGFIAAIDYIESVGWDGITAHERILGERFLAGFPDGYQLHGIPAMEQRVPTFAMTLPGRAPQEIAETLAERDIAVWAGNYYAVEVMKQLGLPDGAVRIGFVHYNTEDEVDRVLLELDRLS